MISNQFGGEITYTVIGVFSCSHDGIAAATVKECTWTDPEHYVRLVVFDASLEVFGFNRFRL